MGNFSYLRILNLRVYNVFMITEGLTYTTTATVTAEQSAAAMGSGSLPVFATPAMVALMENAAMNTVASLLPEGSTTVGGAIDVVHSRPTAIGAEVGATATLTAVDGRKLLFDIVASDANGTIGTAKHIRFIVDEKKFMSKV